MSDETMATLKVVREFFGMTVTEFREQWTKQGLTDADKVQIREGLYNGSMSY